MCEILQDMNTISSNLIHFLFHSIRKEFWKSQVTSWIHEFVCHRSSYFHTQIKGFWQIQVLYKDSRCASAHTSMGDHWNPTKMFSTNIVRLTFQQQLSTSNYKLLFCVDYEESYPEAFDLTVNGWFRMLNIELRRILSLFLINTEVSFTIYSGRFPSLEVEWTNPELPKAKSENFKYQVASECKLFLLIGKLLLSFRC